MEPITTGQLFKLTPETEVVVTGPSGQIKTHGTIKRYHPSTGIYVIELYDHSLIKATRSGVWLTGLTKHQLDGLLDKWWKLDSNLYQKLHHEANGIGAIMLQLLMRTDKVLHNELMKWVVREVPRNQR